VLGVLQHACPRTWKPLVITAAEVAAHLPMLADRVAVSTERGLHAVAEALVRAAFPERIEQLPLSAARDDRLAESREVLRSLLAQNASTSDLRLFLSSQQDLLPRRGLLIPSFKRPAGHLFLGVASFLTRGAWSEVSHVRRSRDPERAAPT
jgi:hypothetical protein